MEKRAGSFFRKGVLSSLVVGMSVVGFGGGCGSSRVEVGVLSSSRENWAYSSPGCPSSDPYHCQSGLYDVGSVMLKSEF